MKKESASFLYELRERQITSKESGRGRLRLNLRKPEQASTRRENCGRQKRPTMWVPAVNCRRWFQCAAGPVCGSVSYCFTGSAGICSLESVRTVSLIKASLKQHLKAGLEFKGFYPEPAAAVHFSQCGGER